LHLTLAKARNIRDVSQEQLALELGISIPTMVKFEKNLTLMRISMAHRVAEILDMEFDGKLFVLDDKHSCLDQSDERKALRTLGGE
jgi:transcriptional regulator with XRE-family HTH domain